MYKEIKNQNNFKLNFKIKKSSIRGYSIIEILVYLAIFTAISILVINLFITILSSFNTANVNRKLLESGQMSMERMTKEIRQAKNIDISNSTNDSLQLNSTDVSGNNVVIKLANISGNLDLYKDGVLIGGLFSENVSLTKLIFRRITTIHGEAVKIEMTLLYSDGRNIKSENFYNTVILRGEYK